jgi:lysophospholipase L1-like esterase
MKTKNLKHTVFLLLTLLFTVSSFAKDCTETHIRDALKKSKRFDFDVEGCADKVISIKKGIGLTGSMVVDGKGKMRLNWTGEASGCDEIPRNREFAVFYTTGNKNVMRNFTILKSPEGIHLSTGSDNLIENVTFDRICEDAITNGTKSSNSAKNSVVRNVKFNNAPDKAVQCNGGSITVENSVFRKIPRAIAGCTYKADGSNHTAKECPIPCTIRAYNNELFGCSGGYGMRGSGYLQGKKVGTLTAIGNTFRDCSTPLMASQYGYVYGEKNKVIGSCEQFAKTEQNSTAELCENNISSCKKAGSGSVTTKCKNVPQPAPKQTSTPTPAPTSSPSPVSGEWLNGSGSGGTLSGDKAGACTRAKERGLDAATVKCSSINGKVVDTKMPSSCSCVQKSAKELSCTAEVQVACQTTESKQSFFAPESEEELMSSEVESFEVAPEEEEIDADWLSATGSGGTTTGDQAGACTRAKQRAVDAASTQCRSLDKEVTDTNVPVSCDCTKTSAKEYSCKVEASVLCEEKAVTNPNPTPSPSPTPTNNPKLPKSIKIGLVGDSTVATYSSGDKQGWGAKLSSYVNTSRTKVENRARGGASTKSFVKLQNWNDTLASKSRYIFVQFGHNDQSGDSGVSSNPKTYGSNLRNMISSIRGKGMIPILVTPLRRVRFSGGKSYSNLKEYVSEMKSVASSLSVPLVDLDKLSGDQYNSWGESKTRSYFVKGDGTHTNNNGASVMAGLVAKEVQRVFPEISYYFK